MSNVLFTNISRIFGAPAEVREILNGLVTAKEGKIQKQDDAIQGAEDVSVDDNGDVEVSHEKVIGKSKDLFGNKVYSDLGKQLIDSTTETSSDQNSDFQQTAKKIADTVNKTINKEIIDKVTDNYGLSKAEAKKQQKQLEKESASALSKIADEMQDKQKVLEAKHQEEQKAARNNQELKAADDKFKSSTQHIFDEFQKQIKDHVNKSIEDTPTKVIERVEKNEQTKKANQVEEDARAHLRGFSRTIPSFIMAYGDENLTLQNFDDYTEDDVFKEVTGITEDQFRFLRDGGDYIEKETGEKKHFEGHLFDEVVFNDSIQQFLQLKDKLSNYFDESNKEDIFDYIPPQTTFQIFTPKKVVKQMVDELEENNPEIFDDPNKTFADLYMKSGLYITEIIKRLYRSQKMKELFPDDKDRIKHIMEHQVYGFAPTRIIYLIATNYIFGFDKDIKDNLMEKHFKQIDAAKYAKEGTLQEIVQKEFVEVD